VKSDRFAPLRDLLEERVRDDCPAAGYHGAIAELASLLADVLTSDTQDVGRSMARFFDAFCQLAAEPASTPARANVVDAAETIAGQLLRVNAGLERVRRCADRELARAVDDANALARRIGGLNVELRSTPAPSTRAGALRDQLRLNLATLSHLVNIDLVRHGDGAVDVSFGPRRPLVLGGSAVPLVEGGVPGSRGMMLSSGGVVVSGDITSGRVGGLLYVRNSLLPGCHLRLDTLAHAFVARVNALHVTGFDADGTPAPELFVPIAMTAGAAAAVSVPPMVRANPGLVAAGTTPSCGDCRGALAIAALRHQVAVGGSWTFAEAWARMVGRVARESETARREQVSRDQLVRQMQSLRDNLPSAERRDHTSDAAYGRGAPACPMPTARRFPA
jgi:flagellar hook-associated protein 1 FlgK